MLLLLFMLFTGSMEGYGQKVIDKPILYRNGMNTGEGKEEADIAKIKEIFKASKGEEITDDQAKEIRARSSAQLNHWNAKFPNPSPVPEFFNEENNPPYFVTYSKALGIAPNILQASHTYIDSVYYVPGEVVELWLPDIMYKDKKVSTAYEHWYNYKTGGTTFDNGVLTFLNAHNIDQFDVIQPQYQFTNGWVSCRTGDIGTHLVRAKFQSSTDTDKKNGYEIVMCNVSAYMDEIKAFTAAADKWESPIEPTLTHRVLFYLKSIYAPSGLMNLLKEKGLVDNDDKPTGKDDYLLEYDVHFPTLEQAYKDANGANRNSRNTISFPMLAHNYCYKFDNDQLVSGNVLTATLDEAGKKAGLRISPYSSKEKVIAAGGIGSVKKDADSNYGTEITFGGRTSSIFLVYPEGGMQPGATATITITNEAGHHIARCKLTFDENTQGLSQTALKQITDLYKGKNVTKGKELTALFKDKTEEQQKELLEKLYTRTDEYIQQQYGEPIAKLDWNYTDNINEEYYPYPMPWNYSNYGFVEFTNGNYHSAGSPDMNYPEFGNYAIIKNIIKNGANDNATSLDSGDGHYHLFVDAADRPGVIAKLPIEQQLCNNSRLVVTMMMKSGAWYRNTEDAAVTFTLKGVDKEGNETNLHRQSSGQIRRSDYNGITQGTNDWFQIAFAFDNIMDKIRGAQQYDHYLLQIENNGASTSGSDIYLDNFMVYVDKLKINAKQLKAPCGGTLDVQLDMSINKLRNRVNPNTEHNDYTIYYSFLDLEKYNEILNGNTANYENAFNAAVIHGKGVYLHKGKGESDDKTPSEHFGSIRVNANEGIAGDDDVVVDKKNDKLIFKSRGIPVSLQGEASVTDYLQAGRTYKVVAVAYETGEEGANNPFVDKNDAEIAAVYDLENTCSISGEFKVSGPDIEVIYGKTDTETQDLCLNDNVPLTVKISDETKDKLGENAPTELKFDYFWSSSSEAYAFMKSDEVYQVIAALRSNNSDVTYTDAETLKKTLEELTAWNEGGTLHGLAEKKEQLIAQITGYVTDGTFHLSATAEAPTDCQLTSATMYYVIFPIEQKLQDETILLCWNSIAGTVEATGGPRLNTGFQGVTYPKDDKGEDSYNPPVRIGLKTLDGAKENTSSYIEIPLRNPRNGKEKVSLQLEENAKTIDLYLESSTDPEIDVQKKVGTVSDFVADKDGRNNHLKIQFANDFTPKEGYIYNLNFTFELKEKEQGGDKCDASSLTFPLYIVPAYQKWIGTATDNWNDDSKWVRSTKEELHSDTYENYTSPYEHKGFVPMSFTNVTIPTTSAQVELYKAGKTTGDNPEICDLAPADKGGVKGDATENIAYHLMADEKKENDANVTYCRPYYTNTVNEIHFEPNTEMSHTEWLAYTKAWVDYDLTANRWYTLASPLQAVVAGDWYAPTEGYRQNTEYFQPIKFDSKINNRFNPAVYQRSWDKGNVTRYELDGENHTEKTYAISGNWSIAYNDVTVPYKPGEGFSIKAVAEAKDGVLFRLPKADPSYDYYEENGAEGKGTTTITRDEKAVGKLLDFSNTTSKEVTLTNTAEDNPYFLVGNPFMAHLDMTKFFETNKDALDGTSYRIVTADGQDVAVKNEDKWLSTSEETPASVAPLQSFFVKKNGTGKELTLSFTTAMQQLGTEASGTDSWLRAATPAIPQLKLVARQGNRVSKALIACEAAASDEYKSGEDAELFLDSNLGNAPAVYTVAGDRAASINLRRDLTNVPLGILNAAGGEVELSISGQEAFGNFELYDAQTGSTRLIGNGEVTVTLESNAPGRYFLRSGYVPTGNGKIEAHTAISIYSLTKGQVIISSVDALRRVTLYDTAGKLLRLLENPGVGTARLDGLQSGVYVVRAESRSAVTVEKVSVR